MIVKDCLYSHMFQEKPLLYINVNMWKLRSGTTRNVVVLKSPSGWVRTSQPTSKPITEMCTPRICNAFETPMFNLGTSQEPRWIQVSRFGSISHSEAPKEFMPLSTNKGEQIVLHHSGVYSDKQKREFQKFSLVRDARELVTYEIVCQGKLGCCHRLN